MSEDRSPAVVPKKPSRKTKHANSPASSWFPLYEEVMKGEFAHDNTVDSLALFLALRFKADICGVVNVVIEEDGDLYGMWMDEPRAQAAFDLLVRKKYIVYDARRSQAFIRSYLKWDRMTFSTSNNFKHLVKTASAINSKVIRREVGLALARRDNSVSSPPTIEPMLQALVRDLLGDDAEAILRGNTISAESEWT